MSSEPSVETRPPSSPSSTSEGGRSIGSRRTGSRSVAQFGMGTAITLSLVPAVLVFLSFFAVPLVVLVVTAFSDWSGRTIDVVGLANFQELAGDRVFQQAAVNTLSYIAAGVLIQLPLGVFVGIFLAGRPRGWRTLLAIVFIPYMISGAVIAMVFTVVYNPRYGLLNVVLGGLDLPSQTDWLASSATARWAVAATFVFTVGFAAVLVSTEMASFPGEVFEAASLDGAAGLRLQRHITVPMLRNVIGTLVLLSVLGNLGAFDIVYILTAGGPADSTATLMVYGYRAYIAGDWGMANAVGTVVVGLGLILIVAIRRLFRIGEPV